MSFNPDPSKQAREITFSRKKHLRMILDNKLNFQKHLKNILNKVNYWAITETAKHFAE